MMCLFDLFACLYTWGGGMGGGGGGVEDLSLESHPRSL